MVRVGLAALMASVAAESCTDDATCSLAKDTALLQTANTKVQKHTDGRPEFSQDAAGFTMGHRGAQFCPKSVDDRRGWTHGIGWIEECRTAFNHLGFDGSKMTVSEDPSRPTGCVKGPGENDLYYNRLRREITHANPDFTPICKADFHYAAHTDEAVRPCGKNVAAGKPVTCSSNIHNCNDAVTDGVTSGSEHHMAPHARLETCDDTAFVVIDLQELTRMDRVKFFAVADGRRKYCHRKVEVSQDGVQWNLVRAHNSYKSYDPVQTEDGTTYYVSGGIQTVRYVKVYQGPNSENHESHFVEVEVTCEFHAECCEATTTTTTMMGQEATRCHALSQQPNRCGANIGRCNPSINAEARDIYCAEGWCEYYQYYADEYAYDYQECFVERMDGSSCSGMPYSESEEEGSRCQGFGFALTEERCSQACDENQHIWGCSVNTCAASVFDSADGSCKLYAAGQCDTFVPAAGMVARKKLEIPSAESLHR